MRLNGYETEAQQLASVNDIATEWYVDPNRREEFKQQMARDGRVSGFESEIFTHRSRRRIWISENAWVVRDGRGDVPLDCVDEVLAIAGAGRSDVDIVASTRSALPQSCSRRAYRPQALR